MSKHTPGPWHIGLRSGHNINIIYARDGVDLHDDTAVAEVFNLPMHTGLDEIPALMERSDRYATGIANARLIAAAPELLEAVAMFLEATEGTALVEAKDAMGNDAWEPIYRAGVAARAAIAKAKGG